VPSAVKFVGNLLVIPTIPSVDFMERVNDSDEVHG